MLHENTLNGSCPCAECNAKDYDFDNALKEMQWRWDSIKLENTALLREFIAIAREIADNSEDSAENVIGEFIINQKYEREN